MTEPTGTRLFSLHLSMVARIALGTGLAAAVILVLTLAFAVDRSGATYAELVQAHAITQRNLGPAFLVGGLALASITGFLTWLICLYSSFRVAGPLFRFTRNLEQASETDLLSDIRRNDCLHDLADELKAQVGELHAHYRRLDALAGKAVEAIERDGEAARDEVSRILEELAEAAGRARLEED